MKEKVGVLYICTGPYSILWKQFYDSMNHNLMPETDKTFYVFTDAERIYKEEEPNVVRIYIDSQPWPLITLLRFYIFLRIEDMLMQNDYLLFCNANLTCRREISFCEILPQNDDRFFFTIHPGFSGTKKPRLYPYERRSSSTAYIPYNCGSHYVIGAFYGGRTKDFLEMCHILSDNINRDLNRNIIAIWHDESHINKFIINRKDVRLLSPSYCYHPFEHLIGSEDVISIIDKSTVFDVNEFKGVEVINRKTASYQKERILKRLRRVSSLCEYFLDTVLNKQV